VKRPKHNRSVGLKEPFCAQHSLGKPSLCQFFRTIDIAMVDHERPHHRTLDPVEVERGKLHPIGDDHQRVGAAHVLTGVAIFDIGPCLARLVPADRIAQNQSWLAVANYSQAPATTSH
jgi:hypothetical protein